jgi:fluoride exporter
MFVNCFMIGAGGAAGAVCRYLFGMLPLKPQNGFPVNTLLINIFGSFCIGIITALAGKNGRLDPKIMLFLKVGFCGGFTTFSTFSLETFGLLQAGNYIPAALYMALSFVLCIAGTAGGMALIQ